MGSWNPFRSNKDIWHDKHPLVRWLQSPIGIGDGKLNVSGTPRTDSSEPQDSVSKDCPELTSDSSLSTLSIKSQKDQVKSKIDDFKSEIRILYTIQNKTAAEVVHYLKLQHNLEIKLHFLKTKLAKWGFGRKLQRPERFKTYQRRTHRDTQEKDSEFMINDIDVSVPWAKRLNASINPSSDHGEDDVYLESHDKSQIWRSNLVAIGGQFVRNSKKDNPTYTQAPTSGPRNRYPVPHQMKRYSDRNKLGLQVKEMETEQSNKTDSEPSSGFSKGNESSFEDSESVSAELEDGLPQSLNKKTEMVYRAFENWKRDLIRSILAEAKSIGLFDISDKLKSCPAHRNGSSSTSKSQISSTSESQKYPYQKNIRRSSNQRNKKKSDDDQDEDDTQPPPSNQNLPASSFSKRTRLFLCPYGQKFPDLYPACSKREGWNETRRLKEHMYRIHMIPPRCARCGQTFDEQSECDSHNIKCDSKAAPPIDLSDGLTPDQVKRMKDKRRGIPEEEKARRIYQIALGEDPNMPTPYIDIDENIVVKSSQDYGDLLETLVEEKLNEKLPDVIQPEVAEQVRSQLTAMLPGIIQGCLTQILANMSGVLLTEPFPETATIHPPSMHPTQQEIVESQTQPAFIEPNQMHFMASRNNSFTNTNQRSITDDINEFPGSDQQPPLWRANQPINVENLQFMDSTTILAEHESKKQADINPCQLTNNFSSKL